MLKTEEKNLLQEEIKYGDVTFGAATTQKSEKHSQLVDTLHHFENYNVAQMFLGNVMKQGHIVQFTQTNV